MLRPRRVPARRRAVRSARDASSRRPPRRAPGCRSGAPCPASRSRSLRVRGRELVDVRPARLVGELPATAVAPAVRQRNGPGVISSVTVTGTSTDARRGGDARAASPSASPAAAASSGWIRSACVRPPRIRSGELCIQELCERSSRRPIRLSGNCGACAVRRLQPLDLTERGRVADVHAAVRVAHPLAEHVRSRCGRRARCRAASARPSSARGRERRRPNQSPAGPVRRTQVDQPPRRDRGSPSRASVRSGFSE